MNPVCVPRCKPFPCFYGRPMRKDVSPNVKEKDLILWGCAWVRCLGNWWVIFFHPIAGPRSMLKKRFLARMFQANSPWVCPNSYSPLDRCATRLEPLLAREEWRWMSRRSEWPRSPPKRRTIFSRPSLTPRLTRWCRLMCTEKLLCGTSKLRSYLVGHAKKCVASCLMRQLFPRRWSRRTKRACAVITLRALGQF